MKQTEGRKDSLWLWSDGKWSWEKVVDSDVKYLRSTPALEHAEEMRDVLERVAYKTSLQSVEAAKDFLDKLEAKEAEEKQ